MAIMLPLIGGSLERANTILHLKKEKHRNELPYEKYFISKAFTDRRT